MNNTNQVNSNIIENNNLNSINNFNNNNLNTEYQQNSS